MNIYEKRLAEKGYRLPRAPAPAASYTPHVRSGAYLYVSGQVPQVDGTVTHQGMVGADLTLEEARAAAEICALNLVAQVAAACSGDLERMARCVKITGFVASAPGFYLQSRVVDGGSELIEFLFAERGRHARSAVGVTALPRNAAVEIEGIFEMR